MEFSNETMCILNAESQEQLRKECDAELDKLRKLRLVLNTLRNIDLPDGGESVERALKVLRVENYLRLNDSTDSILDIGDVRNTVNLTYTERKNIRETLISTINSNISSIVQYGQKMKVEMPELFANTSSSQSTFTSAALPSEIITLVTQHRDNIQKLAELKNRKCAYLKAIAELKMGPYLAHELEIVNTQTRLSQVKANVLQGYFVNELLTRTEHSLKALKEVSTYVDKELEDTMEK